MRRIRLAAATAGLALLAACGPQPATPMPSAPPNGTPIETHLLGTLGPAFGSQAILAASDLDTLRAVIDAMGGQLLVRDASPAPCRQPHEERYIGACWPGVQSQTGRAYIALALHDGYCQQPSRPQLYLLPGRRLLLQVGFSKGSCLPGSGAAPLPGAHLVAGGVPSASLVSISTTGLAPGLYAVSYRFLADGETSDSDPTYLSVPGPVAASQSTIEAQVAALLLLPVLPANDPGATRFTLVSVARLAGDQVGDLCGESVDGPAYLQTIDSYPGASHRQTKVVLAGPTPHTCAATSI